MGMTVEKSDAARVEAWNDRYSIGQAVMYWPGKKGPEETAIYSKTRSVAGLTRSGMAVIWVEGRGGCIALSHVEAVGSLTDKFPVVGGFDSPGSGLAS